MSPFIGSGISTFTCKIIEPSPSHTDALSSSLYLIVGKNVCGTAPSTLVYTRRLHVRDGIMAENCHLWQSSKAQVQPVLPNPSTLLQVLLYVISPPRDPTVHLVSPPAAPPMSRRDPLVPPWVPSSGSDGASRVSSSGSDGASSSGSSGASVSLPRIRWRFPYLLLGIRRRLRIASLGPDGAPRVSSSESCRASCVPSSGFGGFSCVSYLGSMPAAAPAPAPVR